jgi:hypothetical protein
MLFDRLTLEVQGGIMLLNIENQTQTTIGESMMSHFVGSVDLTGAELEFAGCCLNVISGKLGHSMAASALSVQSNQACSRAWSGFIGEIKNLM